MHVKSCPSRNRLEIDRSEGEGVGDPASEVDRWEDEGGHDRAG